MGKLGKILLSFLFIPLLIAGAGIVGITPGNDTEERTSENSDMILVQGGRSDTGTVSLAFVGSSAASEVVNVEDDEIDGNAYASFSPHMDKVSKMTRGPAMDGDWPLVFEQRRDGWHDKDAVFYGDDREAVLEPGAMGVLGFGLIGLFVIIRLRFRK